MLVSPATAARLKAGGSPAFQGGEHGQIRSDVVELRYRGRTVRGAVFVVVGHPDDCVTIHAGYGRTRAGHTGTRAGFNANALRTSDAPWFGGGLEIAHTGETASLACTQYHHLMEGRAMIRAATRDEYLRDPKAVHEVPGAEEAPPRAITLYRDSEFKNTSDVEMWLRIARSYPIGVLEDHLLRYRRATAMLVVGTYMALLFGDVSRRSTRNDIAPELRALQNPTQAQTDILAARATQAITAPISSEVGKVVEQTFGVDTFQLTPSFIDSYGTQTSRVNPTARLTIGKRISDRVYLTFSRSLGTTLSDQILLLEIEQNDRLSWILSRNEDAQTYALEFRVRHTF